MAGVSMTTPTVAPRHGPATPTPDVLLALGGAESAAVEDTVMSAGPTTMGTTHQHHEGTPSDVLPFDEDREPVLSRELRHIRNDVTSVFAVISKHVDDLPLGVAHAGFNLVPAQFPALLVAVVHHDLKLGRLPLAGPESALTFGGCVRCRGSPGVQHSAHTEPLLLLDQDVATEVYVIVFFGQCVHL